MLRLKTLHSDFHLRQLRVPIDPDHWLEFTSVALVNAFADLTANSIKFPAGILQVREQIHSSRAFEDTTPLQNDQIGTFLIYKVGAILVTQLLSLLNA